MTTPTDAPEQRRAPEKPPERRVRLILDRALSASAGLVAACALAVSVYQAYISRQQLKMSAWPYVTQSNTDAGGYAFLVHNVGLGPALVRSMRVYVDGRPVPHWGALLMTALRVDSATLEPRVRSVGWSTSSVRPGMVLLPGTATRLVHVDTGAFARTLRGLLNDEKRVSVRVCYCSLYGDCWMSDSRALEPAKVRACPAADPGLEFQS